MELDFVHRNGGGDEECGEPGHGADGGGEEPSQRCLQERHRYSFFTFHNYDRYPMHSGRMDVLNKVRQTRKFVLVVGEILSRVHVVQIVPLDVEGDASITGPLPDLSGSFH